MITGREPVVVRNDEISWEELARLNPARIIISPGPGSPDNIRDFGICRRVIEEMQCPILGVCLGHQGICLAFGGKVVRAQEVMHGRLSLVFHQGDALFAGVPSSFEAVRYHSLIAESLPACLERIAWSADGEVMGVRHRTKPIWGVQFHPESICTEYGEAILRNFIDLSRELHSGPDAGAMFREQFAGEAHAFWLDGGANACSYVGSGSRVIEGPDALDRLAADLAQNRREPDPALPWPFQGGWVGYITYEGAARFILVDRFVAIESQTAALCQSPGPSTDQLQFDIPKDVYLKKIADCLEAIRAGESYEICLTNQLRGTCSWAALDYFEALRAANPAPFSAYIQHPDLQVACSSPELFLNVTASGRVTSKPIKGTLARSADPLQLSHDEKTRAENLMIVDLVRNDLGRVCQAGSVRVPVLMGIETYATVHQMVSTIEGDLKPGLTALDCIRAAFPPGSMTGAPKLRTMEIIERLEAQPRGIYSGCIGFLSYTGAATFNVVIRSAVFTDGNVSIGTGGAIVSQSDPEKEWDELVLKAEVLVRALRASIG